MKQFIQDKLCHLIFLFAVLPFTNAFGQKTVYVWSVSPGTGIDVYENSAPEKLGNNGEWLVFETGYNMRAGIKADGSLWTWGRVTHGQLGYDKAQTLVPTQAGTDKDWAMLSAGHEYFLAIRKDGTLWAWGDNTYGQLGNGNQTDQGYPVKVGTDNDWVAIKAGQYNSMALKRDGTLYIWGNNASGQIGNGTSGGVVLTPFKVNDDTDWATMAPGAKASAALKKNGGLWMWGTNSEGVFGDGTTVNSFVPKRIGTAIDWQTVALYGNHVLALKTNGDLYSWGRNFLGQIGDGSQTNRTSPYLVGTNFRRTASGTETSAATKRDGTLYTWGHKYRGSLGDGIPNSYNYDNRPTPQLITVGSVKFSGVGYAGYSGHSWVATGAIVTSAGATGPLTTNASSVSFKIILDEPLTGLTTSNFGLDPSSTATGASIASVTAAAGNTEWTVVVNTPSSTGTVKLRMNNSTGSSLPVSNLPYSSTDVYTLDKVAPQLNSLLRNTPAASLSTASSATFKVTFSEDVSGVDLADFALDNLPAGLSASLASVTAEGTSNQNYLVTVNNISGNGVLKIKLASGAVIRDLAGNALPAASSPSAVEEYTIDQVAPAVSSIVRKSPSVQNVNASTVTYTVTFSEPVAGVDAADFTASTVSGSLGKGTLSINAVSSSVYEITIPTISGNGTLRLDLKASGTGISDVAGNAIAAGYNTGETYLIDQTKPVVNTIYSQTPIGDFTNATSVTFRVTFSEAVSGVDASDFTASTVSGSLNKGTLSINAVSSSVYDVTVPVTGDGILRLDLNASGTGISDIAGNAIASGYNTGDTFNIDQTSPVVSSIMRKTPSAQNTNAASLTYRVTFSESVRGVDAADFTATTVSGNITKGTLTATAVSSSVYDITVPGISGNGTLRLDLNASGTGITDNVSNAIAAGYTGGDTYIADQTLPAVSSIVRKTPSAQNTNATSVVYTVTFSEAVTGVDAADFTATTVSGTVNKDALSVTSTSSTVYDITVPAISGNGTLRLDLNASGTGISDLAGNAIAAGFTTGDTYLIDQTLPAVSSIIRKAPAAQNTNATSVVYTVTFSEAVSGVDAADFTATTVSGTLNKGTLGINAVSSSVYDVTVPAISGNGTLRLDLNASGTGITDAADNAIASGFTTGSSYLVDQTPPKVNSIVRKPPASYNTNAASVVYTVTFSESVNGVDAADFTATTVSGSISNGGLSINKVSSVVYDVTVPSITGNGTLRLDLNASGTGITDYTGNEIAAGHTSGQTYLIDQTAPAINSIVRKTPSAQNTNAASVTYTVNFSEAVSGVDISDFTATTVSGALTNGSLSLNAVSSSVYDITITSVSGNGTLRLDLNTSGTGISDLAGNAIAAGFTTGDTYLIDQTLPAVSSIVRKTPAAQNTNAASVVYTVTFSEAVSGVDAADFTATTVSGTLNKGTLGINAVSSSVYDVTVPAISGNGTLRLDLNASGTGISDVAGNAIAAGFTTGNTYLIDQTLPVVNSIVRKTPSAQNSNATSVIYTVTFSEAVTGVDAADFTATTLSGVLNKGTLSINAVSSSVYDVTVPAISGNGTIRLGLNATGTGILDASGSAIAAGFTTGDTYLIDQTPPTVNSIVRKTPSAQNTNATSVVYTVTFSEAVSAVDAADFTATTVSGTVTKGVLTATAVSSSVYEITVPAISGNGTLRLDLNASGTGITDTAGNVVAAGFNAGEIYAIDQTNPVINSILISSNNNDPQLAKEGDAVTVSFQASEEISLTSGGTYKIQIGSQQVVAEADAAKTSQTEFWYKATATMGASETTDGNGNIKISIAAYTDLAGNTGEPMTSTTDGSMVSLDTEAPAKPEPVAKPGNDGHVNTTTPKISGVTEPNATVEIYVDGEKAGEAKADDQGKWEHTFNPPLKEGKHEITIKIRDEAGNTSDSSAPVVIDVDIDTPEQPKAPDQPGNAGHVNTTTPTISGITEPNATVEIYVDGVKAGEAKADGQGKWEHTFNPPLKEGQHEITIKIRDEAGNTSDPSAPVVIDVDIDTPEQPKAPDQPGNAGHVNTTTPTIGGTTEPNATVEIYVDGVKAGEAKADDQGKWEHTFNPPLKEGKHEITIKIRDEAGNTSDPSAPVVINVDIDTPEQPKAPDQPGNGGHVNTTTPTIGGTTEPNATVEIYVDGVKAGEAKADDQGKWEHTFNPPLKEGKHEITIKIRDEAGNTSDPSAPIVIDVDIDTPEQPKAPDQPGNGGHVSTTTPTISGVTEPNATVEIYVDGVKAGEAKADDQGKWEHTFNPPLKEGKHEITIKIRDEAGNTSDPSAPIIIDVDIDTPEQPKAPDQPGNGGHVNTTTPTIGGTTEPNATVEIYVDGVKAGEAKADDQGKWEHTFNPPLKEGKHEITIKIRDEAGNTSDPSAPIIIDVDIDTPVKPEAPQNNSPEGSPTPTIKGTTEANATVEVYVDGKKAGETKSDGTGKWEYTFNPPLTEGKHQITIVIVDPAGNRSEPGAPIEIEVVITVKNTSIQLGTIPHKTYGDDDFLLEAHSNSPAALIYSSSNEHVATIDNSGKIQIHHAGTVTITVSQPATVAFTAASASKELVISKATQTVSVMPVPELQRKGNPHTLITSTSSGLPVEIDIANPLVAIISEMSVVPQGIGTTRVIVSQAGNEDYLPATAETMVRVTDPSGEEIIVSKLITPNGDGINDELMIEGLSNASDHRIVIFNRNGAKLFDSKTYPTGDKFIPHGKSFAGQIYRTGYIPAGSYFYSLEYTLNGVKQQKKGYIVIKY